MAIKSPTGIPMSCASAKPDSTREKLAIQSFQNLPFPTILSSEAMTSVGAGTAERNGNCNRRPISQNTRSPSTETRPRRRLKVVLFFPNAAVATSSELPFAGLKSPYGFFAHGFEDLTLEIEILLGRSNFVVTWPTKVDVQRLFETPRPRRHHQNAISKKNCFFQVMRDEENGFAYTVVGLQQKFLSNAFCQCVHRTEWLIE